MSFVSRTKIVSRVRSTRLAFSRKAACADWLCKMRNVTNPIAAILRNRLIKASSGGAIGSEVTDDHIKRADGEIFCRDRVGKKDHNRQCRGRSGEQQRAGISP